LLAYVSVVANTKPDPTHPIRYNFIRCGCSLMSWPGHIHARQFSLVHVAKCHSAMSWIIYNYFSVTGFRATVCASAGDNRHNCVPSKWGIATREKCLGGWGCIVRVWTTQRRPTHKYNYQEHIDKHSTLTHAFVKVSMNSTSGTNNPSNIPGNSDRNETAVREIKLERSIDDCTIN